MSSHQDKRVDINLEYDSEEQKVGMYTDVTRISVSPYTFSFEFAQGILPQGNAQEPSAKMIVRIVMSPGHAKALYNLLGENLKIFESTFGEAKSFENKVQIKK